MKKTFIYAMLGAIALTGATTVTSCTSTDDVAEVNPTYNPETGEITSQFVLNVATNAKDNASTRSGATTVQNSGNFRGINNTVLLAYQTGGQKYINSTQIAADAAKRYDLGMVAAENSITAANSHRILELSIPTETDALLFYGKAIKGNGSDIEAGKVTYNVTGSKAEQFRFSLNSRVGDNEEKFQQTANLLAAILNRIIAASSSYTINSTTYPDWTGEATISESFKDLGTIYTVNNDNDDTNNQRVLSPLEDILGQAFYTLTTIKDEEYRAGSGDAVIETVKELFDVINSVVNATPTSPYEELGKAVAQAVKTQILKYFTEVADEITGFKTLANIKSESLLDDTEWDNRYVKVDGDDLAAFPTTTFLLPKGCAVMTYDGATNTFSYLLRRAIVGSALSGENEATRYQFPAELMYFANSSIRTSDTEKKEANYPNGVANWDAATWSGDWSVAGSKVTSSTRATAMTQNVNYGVALLETKVGIKEGVTSLEDNNQKFHNEENNKSILPANLDLTLTGVLVGGQPQSVDWQYLPVAGTAYDRVIYDNAIAGGTSGTAVPKAAGSLSASNYTLVFDNYTTAANQISEVRVALEFTNNSDSFWGKDNIVKKGSTFYLIGTLAKGDKTITEWDEYYQVPPLDAAGKSQKITRIFTQDYRTTATFLLNETSLQGAYNTLPDLRSSQISFGLSVDLVWKPGLVFDDVVLGPNN